MIPGLLSQPIPFVSSDDVQRIIRRDFPRDLLTTATAIVDEVGEQKWIKEIPRVQLGALKLANGDLERLRKLVESAKLDYRDILSPAEYPEYAKIVWGNKMPEDERVRIFYRDWKQYDEWLRRD